jgi:PAS domain S-box-containing protein
MSIFSKAPIKNKLIGLTMVTSIISLLMAGTIFMVYDYIILRNNISNKVLILADIIGTNSIVSLEFKDPHSGFKTLNALRLEKQILAASIYTMDNRLFVSFKAEEGDRVLVPQRPREDGEYLTSHDLILFQPIISGNKRVGTIYIRYSLKEVRSNLLRSALIVLAILLLSILIGFLFSIRFQKLISKPILDLADTANKVSSNKDYSIRAVRDSRDEIGILIDHFNEMLAQIQNRDLALQKAQKELQERAREKFELLLNAAGEGIYGLDLEGKVTFANPAAETMLGREAKEIIGKNLHAIIHHSKPDGTPLSEEVCHVHATIKSGKVHHIMDEVFWKKDGSNIPVEYVSNPILENGKLAGAVVTFQDITRRKQHESDLVKAKVEAERANQAKSEFLSRMSHELRTPMNAILGFTQLLQMDQKNPLTDYQMENMGIVSSAGGHLLKLIDEVLDLSKVESGKMDISVSLIDMVPIVDDVISICEPLAIKNGISVEYQPFSGGTCFVEVDALRFKQAVLNLLSNAIKYNKPNGSVIVTFEMQKNTTIRVGVKDTGPGIPEKKKDKIFKPFERFDVNAEKIEGTGIGLTISKQIIEMMKGTIGFESLIGEGCFFYIDLPVAKPSSLPPKVVEAADTNSHSLTKNNKNKILYVEDTQANVELMKQVLARTSPHIELITAPDGLAGIELAQTENPDLILMDIHMPGMDGKTAFKKLQTIESTKDIPVIALSADAMYGDIDKVMRMGFNDYITKPIDLAKLLSTIDKILA